MNFITAVPAQREKANQLAQQFGLTYIAMTDSLPPYCLVVTEEHIESQVPGSSKPLVIDFAAGKAKYRQQSAQKLQHPLVKAVGLKPGGCLQVLDLTAGVGDDSYLLASLGCEVVMLERHPAIAVLLQDALARLAVMAPTLKLKIYHTDAKVYLQKANNPEVIIFDPMFPERPNRSAKAKKTMQLLQGVIGHDEDADDVFRLALSVATKRVIVKRPKTAPVLADTVPSFSIKTKNHRFDGYVVCA